MKRDMKIDKRISKNTYPRKRTERERERESKTSRKKVSA